MKELLYKSAYRAIYYDTKNKLLQLNYFEGSSECTDREFREETKIFAEHIDTQDVELIYMNLIDFHYIIVPEVQKWVAEIMQPTLINAKVKKIAFLVNEDIFSKVSVRQTAEKVMQINELLERQHFTNEKQAKEWLLN